jgi:hypothetical protein
VDSGQHEEIRGTMKALSGSDLRVDRFDGELQFTLTRETGWLEIAVTSGVIAGIAIYAIIQDSGAVLCLCLFAIGTMLFRWAKGPTTIFRLSNSRLTAAGRLDKWWTSEVDISASEVASIGWLYGSKNRSSGLYVWHGDSWFGKTCVLPGLPKKKAETVTSAITAQFPQFRIEP